MSDRIDRDVINALIAGHFADPFSVLGMHKNHRGTGSPCPFTRRYRCVGD